MEEERIGQPRADHLGIARLDRRALVGRFQIGDNDEMRGERAGFIAHSERLLMALQRQANDFNRQLQKFRVHIAEQRHGIFDKASDFIEQAFILDPIQIMLLAERACFFADNLFAHIVIEQNMPLAFQLGAAIRKTCHCERSRSHLAVPMGNVPALNAAHLNRDHVTVEQ